MSDIMWALLDDSAQKKLDQREELAVLTASVGQLREAVTALTERMEDVERRIAVSHDEQVDVEMAAGIRLRNLTARIEALERPAHTMTGTIDGLEGTFTVTALPEYVDGT